MSSRELTNLTMKNTRFLLFLSIIGMAFIPSCTPDSESPVLKAAEDDPYQSHLPTSQFFTLNSDQDTVLEGTEGTTLVLPKGCFLDADGNTYTGSVELELAEANKLENRLLGNIASGNQGKPIVSKGSIFWNATTTEGEQLKVNPENPIFIEMPTYDPNGDLEVRHGTRDEEGNMTWDTPKPLEKFLTPVELSEMDFYPDGFEEAVERGMPFRGHLVADRDLKDSLFYSLSLAPSSFLTEGFALTDSYEEALEWSRDPNDPNIIRANKVSRDKFNLAELESEYPADTMGFGSDAIYGVDSAVGPPPQKCGIDPASIKVLRSEKYAQTLIATKEFQERIRYIFKTCSQEVLEVYIQGLDAEMWENDQKAADLLGAGALKDQFQAFADEKMGHLREGSPISNQLKKHYAKKLKKTRQKLQKALEKAKKELAAKNKVAQETVDEYSKVLDERQAYRMERFGFIPTETGWFDVQDPASPYQKDWVLSGEGNANIEVTVIDEEGFDRTMVYMVASYVNSLHRMSSLDGKVYQTGTGEYSNIPIPKGNVLEVFVIAWKGEESFYAETVLRPEQYQKTVEPRPLKMDRIREKIREVDWNLYEVNQIAKDLEFQKKLFAEEKRQKTLQKEEDFLKELYYNIHFCCTDAHRGERLFKENCARCHSTQLSKVMTGPALLNVTQRHSREWFYPWIKNSAAVIASGDPEAVRLYEEYNKANMAPMPHLTDADIDAILGWIQIKSIEYNNQNPGNRQ